MYPRAHFLGSLILCVLCGLSRVDSEECCQTGLNEYELCSDSESCCGSGSYGRCCSFNFYISSSSNSVDSSKCEGWWAANIWAPIVISIGSIAGLSITISLICCILKACTASNRRTGPQALYPGQPAQGIQMVGAPAYPMQQQQLQQHLPQQLPQQVPYGAPIQQPQTSYTRSIVGTPGYVAPTKHAKSSEDTKPDSKSRTIVCINEE